MGNQENAVAAPPVQETVSPAAWIVLFSAYLASVIASYVFLVVPSLMPAIIGRYNIGLSSAGLTMAVFSFIGLVLSLPAGMVLQKFGIKVVGILAMAATALGCVVCVMAPTFAVFLMGRGLQGIGFTFIAMVGMTSAGMWFPPSKVSVAMGLMGTCVGVGGFVGMALTPRLLAALGPNGVWWASAGLSLFAMLLVTAFVRMPPWVLAAAAAGAAANAPKPDTTEGYRNRNIWFLTAAFACFYLVAGALMTFYITYLTKACGMNLEAAGQTSGLMMIGLLVGSPLAGAVLVKIGHLKTCLVVTAVLLMGFVATGFSVTGAMIPIWCFLFGVIAMGVLQVICMTAIPGIMAKPELISVGFGIYMLGANLSGIIGPPYVGAIVQKTGSWAMGGYAMLPVIALGILFTFLTKFAGEK